MFIESSSSVKRLMSTTPPDQGPRQQRLARVKEIVDEDFERVAMAASPHDILGVAEHDPLHHINERFERYERFYRAENFQRLGDLELTRKALEIRRAMGRAIVDIRRQVQQRAPREEVKRRVGGLGTPVPEGATEDERALGDIYLRDGITYLHLGDIITANHCFERAALYDNTRAITMAYLGYVTYKRYLYDPRAVQEARSLLDRAAELDPMDPEVFVLRGRFFARLRDPEALEDAVEHVRHLDPVHPLLDKLERKLQSLDRELATVPSS